MLNPFQKKMQFLVLALMLPLYACSTHTSNLPEFSNKIPQFDGGDGNFSPSFNSASTVYYESNSRKSAIEVNLESVAADQSTSKTAKKDHPKRWRRHFANTAAKQDPSISIPANSDTLDSVSELDVISSTSTSSGCEDVIATNIPPYHHTKYIAECKMPTETGNFVMRSYNYTSPKVRLEPVVVIHGNVRGKSNVLVRVHDQCFTSEVFGSMRCGNISTPFLL